MCGYLEVVRRDWGRDSALQSCGLWPHHLLLVLGMCRLRRKVQEGAGRDSRGEWVREGILAPVVMQLSLDIKNWIS